MRLLHVYISTICVDFLKDKYWDVYQVSWSLDLLRDLATSQQNENNMLITINLRNFRDMLTLGLHVIYLLLRNVLCENIWNYNS